MAQPHMKSDRAKTDEAGMIFGMGRPFFRGDELE
jgi:hypothetical protein